MTSQETKQKRTQSASATSDKFPARARFIAWILTLFGGAMIGFGVFASFFLGGIKDIIDISYVTEYPTIFKIPESSYYYVKNIESMGLLSLFFGIVLVLVVRYWDWVSKAIKEFGESPQAITPSFSSREENGEMPISTAFLGNNGKNQRY